MTKEIIAELSAPFHPDDIKQRYANMKTRTGKKLSYIDARNVMERLDQVVGLENWQSKVTVQCEKTLCELSVKINKEWITKTDGAGDTQISGEKGGVSDAFKRAAVLFGIGRYLYEGRNPTTVYNEYLKMTKGSVVSKSKGGSQDLGAKELLCKLQECEDDNDLNQFRMEYSKLAKSLPEKDKILAKFKKLKTKFKKEIKNG